MDIQNPHMWTGGTACLPQVGPVSVKGSSCPCGENGENSSTNFSTGKCGERPNPYFGRLGKPCPHMGVALDEHFLPTSDLSTPDATYPQIIATYPQISCLDKLFLLSEHPKCGRLFQSSAGEYRIDNGLNPRRVAGDHPGWAQGCSYTHP
jgi:hypothetical protein